MSNEVRVMSEGSFSMVQASASGGDASGARVWATASAPASAVGIAYVDSFQFTSARTIQTQSNRGVPTHHKNVDAQPVQVTLNVRWTGDFSAFETAEGASVPMVHGEFKAVAPENGGTGRYFQFHGMNLQQIQFSEAAEGDTLAMTFVALGMNGATGSGFLS